MILLAIAIKPGRQRRGAGARRRSRSRRWRRSSSSAARRATPRARREPGFSSPPAGLVLETPEQIAARAQDIKSVVSTKAMPLGNLTKHDERRARPRRRLGHPGRLDEGMRRDAEDHRRRLLVHRPARGGGRRRRRSPRSGGCCRSSRRSSTCAGAARRAGSRSATSISASGPRTRPATRIPARSSSTRAASRRRRSCWPTATSTSPPRRAQLAGNHFATVVEGGENLRPLGVKFLWEGAQEIGFVEE